MIEPNWNDPRFHILTREHFYHVNPGNNLSRSFFPPNPRAPLHPRRTVLTPYRWAFFCPFPPILILFFDFRRRCPRTNAFFNPGPYWNRVLRGNLLAPPKNKKKE